MTPSVKIKLTFIGIMTLSIFIIAGLSAAVFAYYDHNRIKAELASYQSEQLSTIEHFFTTINDITIDQVHRSMAAFESRVSELDHPQKGQKINTGSMVIDDLIVNHQTQFNNPAIVDDHTKVMGGTATIFTKHLTDFVRLTTNVEINGKRIVGSLLNTNGKAIDALTLGQSYFGTVDIVGEPFISGYTPIKDKETEIIGALYVGYRIDTKAINTVIEKSRVMNNGFVAVVDKNKRILFHSDHLTREAIEKAINSPGNWTLVKHYYPVWEFEIISGYSNKELTGIILQQALVIIGFGLIFCLLLSGVAIVAINHAAEMFEKIKDEDE